MMNELYKNCFDVEIEQLILGMILDDNKKLNKVITVLEPKHFYEPLHQDLFIGIREEIMKDNFVDLNIANKFISQYSKKLDGKTLDYLDTVHFKGKMNTAIVAYTTRLVELYQKRLLVDTAEFIKGFLHEKKPTDLMNEVGHKLASNVAGIGVITTRKVRDIIDEIIENYQKGTGGATSTGLFAIDEVLNGGFERGRNYCIAGAPKAGKTQFLVTISNNIRKAGKKIAYICAEMSDIEILKRIVACELDIYERQLVRKQDDNVNQKVMDKLVVLRNSVEDNFIPVNTPRVELEHLKNIIATKVRENGVEGIVVDYLQLIKVNNKNMTVSQMQEEVAQTLAEYAKKFNIWILYASQINREGQIRNGAGIEQAVDWAYEINKNESNEIYLKPIVSRHTAGYSIGSETNRVFRIAEKGTHIIENNTNERYSHN